MDCNYWAVNIERHVAIFSIIRFLFLDEVVIAFELHLKWSFSHMNYVNHFGLNIKNR